jgi:4-aminobutyrate aminotransferase-like enzyme
MLNLGLDASILSCPESVQLMNEVMSQIAPYGMKHATLTNGSSAVEEAIQAAMSQRTDGQQKFTVLGFHGSAHGDSVAEQDDVGIVLPSLDQPKVRYPRN